MIIVSITGPTREAAFGQIARSRKFASMFELRLDLLHEEDVRPLIQKAGRPVIATCRPAWEGGGFAGNEPSRLALLADAVRNGASYVDLELQLGAPAIRRFAKQNRRARVIASRHYFDGTVPDPLREYQALRLTEAPVLKLAYRATDVSDMQGVIAFLRKARANRQKAIAIAMGEAGEPSRILYRKFGGWAMYAAPLGGPPAADGQVPADRLHSLFRADELSASTKVYGVVGNPVRYSKGIFLHNPLLQRARKNAVYCRFEVHDLARFMRDIVPYMEGMSVTLPHKIAVMDFLDDVDERARTIGAVNTVIRQGKRLRGDNTDGSGALDAIEAQLPVRGKQVLVLGAGGAARAIVVEAVRRGAMVSISNRTFPSAVALAEATGAKAVTIEEGSSYDIVANATSVGMAPDVDSTPLPAGYVMMKVAFDAVYQPAETRFLREAKEHGATTVSGVEMYLNQAAAQSRMYTGIQPDLRTMRKLMTDALST